MHIIFPVLFFVVAAIHFHIAETSTCYVVFYWDSGYQGSSFVLYAGQSRQDLTQYNFNDAISSLQFFPGSDGMMCWVHACWNTYCSGWQSGGATDYIDNQAYVGDFANDVFSSVAVSSVNPKTDPWVQLYKDCSTAGYQWFVVPSEINGGKNIFANDLGIHEIGNDALSRVVIGSQAAVTLYWDDYYQGSELLIIGPANYACLTQQSFNDVTSSILFSSLANGAFPVPVGTWDLQTSAGYQQQLSWTLSYGYTSTDTQSTTSTFGWELTASITAGVEFDSATLSSTISGSIANTVETSTAKSESITCLLTCAPGTCTSGTTYLYTWHMAFTRPWDTEPNTQLDTCNYVCRCSGTPPACALTNCKDAACNYCIQ